MLEYIHCAECARDWTVSTEDPDSTLSDAMEHVRTRHRGAKYDIIRPGKFPRG